jgi:hypothetical protein
MKRARRARAEDTDSTTAAKSRSRHHGLGDPITQVNQIRAGRIDVEWHNSEQRRVVTSAAIEDEKQTDHGEGNGRYDRYGSQG